MHQLKNLTTRHNFRQGNEVAHVMAKAAIMKNKLNVPSYMARPPDFVEKQLEKKQ